MSELILSPWPWYVVGPLISFVMIGLVFVGKQFGISSTMKTICTIGGAGKIGSYFDTSWKDKTWGLIFALGAVIGGYISNNFLSADSIMMLNDQTVYSLESYGWTNVGKGFLPDFFSFEALTTPSGFIMLVVGGFLVGFGARYAEGCTSGHAITGLSNLQLPSLLAVIGFFAGGLIATHYLLPILL